MSVDVLEEFITHGLFHCKQKGVLILYLNNPQMQPDSMYNLTCANCIANGSFNS